LRLPTQAELLLATTRTLIAMAASGCQPRQPDARKQYIHGALATGAESKELIRGAAHVVAHDARMTAGRHRARVFAQVAFETTAGQQTRVFAVGGDEHLRSGFGIGGTASPNDGGEYQGLIGKQRAVVEREEAVQRHVGRKYMPL
jgi:hypothetical protein